MHIPPNVSIKFLSDFCIIKFKNKAYHPESPLHNYINVPINDDSSLLLCIFTSQVENQASFYNRVNKKALDSLVYLKPNELPFLTVDTLIDCNNPELIPKENISDIVDEKHGLKITLTAEKIPHWLKVKTIEAVFNSPLVKPYIKNMINKSILYNAPKT